MPRKPPLAVTHPELAKQWHPTKNGDLTPEEVTHGSSKKIWWICNEGPDHEWESPIKTRVNGSGCLICSGRKAVKSNCLSTTHALLAKQWHPTRNGELTPDKVTNGSDKKVWWKCPVSDDHEWQATVSSRSHKTKGRGCPFCSGKKVCFSNSLKNLNPELAAEWHPTKNGDFTPDMVTEKTAKKVWWICNKGPDHEWEAKISNRSNGRGCPICRGIKIVNSNSLETLNPEVANQWHPSKNGNLTPKDVSIHSNKKVWWKCSQGFDHEWQAVVSSRNKNGCPYCSNQKVSSSNSLKANPGDILKFWHPTKNGDLKPSMVTPGSRRKVWWLCTEGPDHEWESTVANLSTGNRCPVCVGKKVVKSNSLKYLNPDLAKQWHPTKNGSLKPGDVTLSSNKKIWWFCDKGEDHIWKATPNNRNLGKDCPVCVGKKVVESNSLKYLNPKLALEWHPSKNGNLTPNDVTTGSNKMIWWQCTVSEDHTWRATVGNRTKLRGCPFCTLTPQSRQELIITFELLKFFKDINPKGYKTRLNGKLRAIDIFIPDLNLAIEFDGSYWHKDKRAIDKIKSEMLMDEGYKVIRIREQPLKKIHDNDIISKLPYNGKEITDNILKRIMELYSVKYSMKRKIQNYMSKDGLQNEKALDKYIDQILEEKALKKK